MLVETIDTILSILAIAGLPIIALMATLIIAKPKKGVMAGIYEDLKRNGLWIAFALALTATLGSLFYSEVAGYTPCTLCWYQRILMYPLSIILLVAATRNDKEAWRTVLPLSILGTIIAAYHYILQVAQYTGTCMAGGVDCAQAYTFYAGFVSIPFMALVAFLLITGFTLAASNKKRLS